MKKGDRVKVKELYNGTGYVSQLVAKGEILTIADCFQSSLGNYYQFLPENGNSNYGKWAFEFQLELLNNNCKNMDIKEKFALALTKEPMKSFRKVGITNGDDLLTEDGMKVFLSWLLNKKFADEFKTDVVDDMLKDLEDEK